ncbi:MAG: hypothetical protein ABIF01_04305, partial [Candidatus Micrarchaeota archaeon]
MGTSDSMGSEAFKKRVVGEYSKWLIFVTGKTERVDVPFFPVSSFDRAMFTDFVAELVTRTIGPDFTMLSVITENGKPLFTLIERVEKGTFVSISTIKPGESVEELKKRHGVSITKSVERSVLEEVFALQERYRGTKDKRTYLLELSVILANALKEGKLELSPSPPVVKALRNVIMRIKVDLKLLIGARDYLASIEMVSGKRSLFLDLGTPIRIVIKKEHLFSLISKLERVESLAGLLDSFLVWLAEGFKTDSIRVEPGAFIWKGLESIVEHDAERIGSKMIFMLSMFADPLFVLVMIGQDSYLLEFRKGVIYGLERVDAKGDLKSAWLDLSLKKGFVHLGIMADPAVLKEASSPVHLPSVLKRGVYEFYPKNEFVEHL